MSNLQIMKKAWLVGALCFPLLSTAQQTLPLDDMSFWKSSDKTNWQIAGDVTADISKPEAMTIATGKGVLANLPNPENRSNLVSVAEYGDVDVSFDFMMAAHSNSGFYLQGRYEVQLFDSWGVKQPAYSDCGGIYKRRKFIPQEYLYEGHAPRTNACLAPGLWQHLEISFQAPKFDAAGNKTSNAKRRVDNETARIGKRLSKFQLQQIIHNGGQGAQVAEEIADACTHRRRRNGFIGFGDGLDGIAISHIVKFVNSPVDAFERVFVLL